MNEAKVYIVLLQRVDLSEPLEMLVTDVETQAIAKLQELDEMWVSSVEKKHPFRIDYPYKGSFVSSLVKEIKVQEMSVAEFQQRMNPYEQEMRSKGLTGWMNTNFNK